MQVSGLKMNTWAQNSVTTIRQRKGQHTAQMVTSANMSQQKQASPGMVQQGFSFVILYPAWSDDQFFSQGSTKMCKLVHSFFF